MLRRILLTSVIALVLAGCAAPAGPTSTLPASAAPAACNHPFFPLAPGARWTYSDGRTWAVTAVTGNATSATVSVQLTIASDDSQHTSEWKCENGKVVGGVLATLYGLSPASGGGILPGGQTMVNTSGQFLPEAARLGPNVEWSQTFSEQLQVASGGTTANTIEQYAVAGMEPVTFAGTSYDGLRLTGRRSVDEAQDIGGQVTHTPVSDVTFELVLARGVGLVRLRLQDTVSGPTDELTLTDFHRP